ncbi:DUF262 domain-containing HNH endonuclease family protein [Paenibacillus sp. sptzw28]|uniref:DUF262 domain-containing protein n=1 Tax=Paenibacillus sp. sptzw28 TaxID=715179 RepID=UPI001C6EED03|nr:DUF262 domain-containing protein [Paenibacillus sp. sptzw28]QYR20996.1 DUF262 domain-containing HNH endonuclease family protein [Paenibacillus sp. sptzw28]
MIEPRDFFSAKEHNLRTLLFEDNKLIRVPDYQRNFAWTKEELEQLWSDFKNTFESTYDSDYQQKPNIKPHFFGTILLTKTENGEYEITDGQQRLTASSIFLKAMLEITARLSDTDFKSGIRSMITPLLQKNEYDEPLKQRLYLDETVDDLYREYILIRQTAGQREEYLLLNPIKIQSPTSARQRLKEGHDFFVSKLNSEFPPGMNEEDLHNKLRCFVRAFTRLFTFLEITVKDKETAYTIFGTINNRGKDLTDSDIIKNEIFKSVQREQRHLIKDKWDSIIDNIDTEDLTDYLRFQHASVHGPVKKVELFKVISNLLLTNNPLDYLEQLRVESDWYARVNLIGATFWNENITNKLKAFKTLDITHSLPMLLTAAVKYNNEDQKFERLVNATLSFCFRYFTIGRNSVENLEKEIGLMSKALRDGTRDLDSTINYIKSLTSDHEFNNNFITFRTNNSNLAFYILNELERNRMTGVVPLPHSPSQHVEHIMPKKPSKAATRVDEWGHVRNNPEYSDFVTRLGNLLILESDKNQNVGNKDFNDKKQIYQTSGLSYPRDISASSTYIVWDFASINTRQQRMAQEALNVWRYY